MSYIKHRVHLSNEQLRKLQSAGKKNESVTVQIDPKKPGNFELYLTQTQINKLKKGGARITLSKTQIKKNGGFLFSLGLPALLGAVGAISGIAGAASNIAKTVQQKKHQRKSEAEQIRHNAAVEQLLRAKGKGAFLPRKQTRYGEGNKKK